MNTAVTIVKNNCVNIAYTHIHRRPVRDDKTNKSDFNNRMEGADRGGTVTFDIISFLAIFRPRRERQSDDG